MKAKPELMILFQDQARWRPGVLVQEDRWLMLGFWFRKIIGMYYIGVLMKFEQHRVISWVGTPVSYEEGLGYLRLTVHGLQHFTHFCLCYFGHLHIR